MTVYGYASTGINWQGNSTLLCLFGGIILGVLASIRNLVFGKVTGISGILSGSIKFIPFDKDKFFVFDRLAKTIFVLGLIGGGILASHLFPDCFENWDNVPFARLFIAGFFVGFGTLTGNGCTSGHGISGISAIRFRSITATCAFMFSGFITAIVSDTSSYLPPFVNTLNVDDSLYAVIICVVVCILFGGIAYHLRSSLEADNIQNTIAVRNFTMISELIFGATFAMAMAVSNMTKLSATISFLDLRYWNPALAFIMASAIGIGGASNWFIFQREFPFLDVKFHRPASDIIDSKLICGALIFGIGWGLAGACPGPALVNLGSGNYRPWLYIIFVLLGMFVQHIQDLYYPNLLKFCGKEVVSDASAKAPKSPPSPNKDNQVEPEKDIENNEIEAVENNNK